MVEINGDYIVMAGSVVIFGSLLIYLVRLSSKIKILEKWRR